MRLLAIDTSGLVAAVAVAEDGRLLAEFRTQYKKTHSQMLMPMLDALRQAIDLDLATLDYIAVAEGPGSFTGLRIGAATAKGMAFALGIPIVPVPTTDAMAWQLAGERGTICPLLDARRGQVYAGLYQFADRPRGADVPAIDVTESVNMEILRAACAVSAEEIVAAVNGIGAPVVFLGDGVPVYKEVIAKTCRVPYRFAPLWKNRQSAAALADLAGVLARQGKAVSADDFAPVYLRASQAEREAAEKSARAHESVEENSAADSKLTDVVIREMRAEDAEAAAALEASCLGREAWTAAMLREAAGHRDSVYLVAEADGRAIGHAGLREVCGVGEIANVCVDEAHRRRGVGTALMRGLLARGRALGAGDCTLEVRAGNTAALRLYEKNGFRTEGRRPGFYESPREDAAILWLRAERSGENGEA